MSTEFTEGLWEFEIDKFGDWGISAEGEKIMCDTKYYPWCPANKADWHLIASAPDLYSMLERCSVVLKGIQYRHNTSVIEDTLDEISKELAKARGES